MFGRGRSSHHALAEMADRLGLDNRKLGARARVAPERVAYALENDIDLEAVLSVGEVKRILEVLDMDFLELFNLPCAFCRQADRHFVELQSLPRDMLIARRREELGLSQEELLAKLGITEWFRRNSERTWAQSRMRLWRTIEERPDSLDDLSLDQIRLLNRVLLLPLQLLLGVRCTKCGA